MNGRAKTPEQKREVIERIYAAWVRTDDQRLGQFLWNAWRTDPFNAEDYPLADACESTVKT